jgi:hypothetical protein
MDAACAHLVLVLPGTRFALVVGSLTFGFDDPRPKRMPDEATPTPANPRGEAGAEFAISHLVQHLE